jgi:hypothetical protein
VSVLSVFTISGLSRLSGGGMDSLGHSAWRELVVLPVWSGSGSWVWAVVALTAAAGAAVVLGLRSFTGRWPQRPPSSGSVRRARSR